MIKYPYGIYVTCIKLMYVLWSLQCQFPYHCDFFQVFDDHITTYFWWLESNVPPKRFLYTLRLWMNSLVFPNMNMQRWCRGKYHTRTHDYFRHNFNIKLQIIQEQMKDRLGRLRTKSLERACLASLVTRGRISLQGEVMGNSQLPGSTEVQNVRDVCSSTE